MSGSGPGGQGSGARLRSCLSPDPVPFDLLLAATASHRRHWRVTRAWRRLIRQMVGPTIPSSARCLLSWKFLTAFSVFELKIPSMPR